MNILGLSAFYHDSAAALVMDGVIVAAAQEERFSRRKHDANFPRQAIKYCLSEGGICLEDVDYIVYYDHPLQSLDRYVKNILACGTDCGDLLAFGYERMFTKKLWVHKYLDLDEKTKFLVCRHHVSHAASAFYPSPFHRSVILTIDGVGEWATLSIGVGFGNRLEIKEEMRYPHSLGLFYSAFSYFCGFKVNSGEYKFMGLAPYGNPTYRELILEKVIDVKEDGSFHLHLDYFDFQYGRQMINEVKFAELFGGERRKPETTITRREMDIAASVQAVTELIILRIASYAKRRYGADTDNLVLAGGVALNCVANGKLSSSGIFKRMWVQPAAGDAGGALGAALYAYYGFLNLPRMTDEIHDGQHGSYLGPCYSVDEISAYIAKNKIPAHLEERVTFPATIAKLLADGNVVGLFQGRMEFGPRALGSRSILADPRSEEMQTKLNLKIKFRESFRPFAPAVLCERVQDYFETDKPSPYMLVTAYVREERRRAFSLNEIMGTSDDMLKAVKVSRSDIPAVTHVDYSARLQTVSRETNPFYYDIIKAFEDLTGCAVLVNTSFNVRGEPIVCTPDDAYRCFMRSDMDVLVMENFILYKEEQLQTSEKDETWKSVYALD